MSEHEIVFGTPEHIAGLSRRALEEDFRWVQDRRMELEDECERLDAENAKLREVVRDMNECLEHCKLVCEYCKFQGVDYQWFKFIDRMRELGVEVDA